MGVIVKQALYNEETNKLIGLYDNIWICDDVVFVRIGNKNALLSKDGTEIISLKYHELVPWGNNLVRARYCDRYALFDKTGKKVVPFKYSIICGIKYELARVCSEGKWGYMNNNGKVVRPLIYDMIFPYDNNAGVSDAFKDRKHIYLDIYGDEIQFPSDF